MRIVTLVLVWLSLPLSAMATSFATTSPSSPSAASTPTNLFQAKPQSKPSQSPSSTQGWGGSRNAKTPAFGRFSDKPSRDPFYNQPPFRDSHYGGYYGGYGSRHGSHSYGGHGYGSGGYGNQYGTGGKYGHGNRGGYGYDSGSKNCTPKRCVCTIVQPRQQRYGHSSSRGGNRECSCTGGCR